MFKFAGKALSLTAASLMVTTAISSAQSLAEIEAAAKAEGMLTTIALPHDWCGYGEVIAGFKKKYPEITVNELNPDAGSADEVEAIKANKDNKGPQAPDVIDVGLAFGPVVEGRRPDAALQGVDLGRDPGQRQGCGRPLVRRLLRRHVVSGEQGPGRRTRRPTGPT
jgi:ABC-type glycerol-3-phosphate transport system substrate-binding protein